MKRAQIMAFRDGERQVAPTLEGIRADHRSRYEFAAKKIDPNSCVIDFACGVGYGSKILANEGHKVLGYDNCEEALDYAKEFYYGSNAQYLKNNAEIPDRMPASNASVCFETLEHLQDPKPLLLALRQASPFLICSVPNEDVMPYEISPGETWPLHYRHYRKNEFADLLRSCGWCPVEWWGQLGDESEVEENICGRTLIAVCMRDELPMDTSGDERHISILGLGPSLDQYIEITKRLGGRSNFCDETWAINALGDVLAADLIFHMDDIRIQEIRAAALPSSNIAAMVRWLKTSPVPIVTSRKHLDYPAMVDYPLEDILNHLGHDYFNSTAAYAIAFAIHIGATKISIFGMDFSYPNQRDAEKGRACVEFWLGQAHARGIKINLPKTTTLLDSMYPRSSRLYGYDTQDIKFISQENGTVKLEFIEKENLPTAEEIEKSYDHSLPIDQQHIGSAK